MKKFYELHYRTFKNFQIRTNYVFPYHTTEFQFLFLKFLHRFHKTIYLKKDLI